MYQWTNILCFIQIRFNWFLIDFWSDSHPIQFYSYICINWFIINSTFSQNWGELWMTALTTIFLRSRYKLLSEWGFDPFIIIDQDICGRQTCPAPTCPQPICPDIFCHPCNQTPCPACHCESAPPCPDFECPTLQCSEPPKCPHCQCSSCPDCSLQLPPDLTASISALHLVNTTTAEILDRFSGYKTSQGELDLRLTEVMQQSQSNYMTCYALFDQVSKSQKVLWVFI